MTPSVRRAPSACSLRSVRGDVGRDTAAARRGRCDLHSVERIEKRRHLLQRRLPRVTARRVESRVRHAEPEHEATAGQFGQRLPRLRHRVRIAHVHVRDAGGDRDALGLAEQITGGRDRFAAEEFRQPEAVVAARIERFARSPPARPTSNCSVETSARRVESFVTSCFDLSAGQRGGARVRLAAFRAPTPASAGRRFASSTSTCACRLLFSEYGRKTQIAATINSAISPYDAPK